MVIDNDSESVSGFEKHGNGTKGSIISVKMIPTRRKPSTHERRSCARKTGSESPENSRLSTNSPDWMHSKLVGTTMKRAL